jgi:hypothetical protein
LAVTLSPAAPNHISSPPSRSSTASSSPTFQRRARQCRVRQRLQRVYFHRSYGCPAPVRWTWGADLKLA